MMLRTGLTLCLLLVGLFKSGQAPAAVITASDGGGTAYGDCLGFGIDFDTSAADFADWTPDLADGQSYNLDFLSVRFGGAQANTTAKYLGVYSGFSGGTFSGFLGVSTNAIDFTTAVTGDWQQFNFSGINVIADSTVGSGSGMLYFAYQTGTSAITGGETTVSTMRFNTDTTIAQSLSSVIAFGTLQAVRAPEYQASLTAVAVPEPSTLAILGITGFASLAARRRNKASS